MGEIEAEFGGCGRIGLVDGCADVSGWGAQFGTFGGGELGAEFLLIEQFGVGIGVERGLPLRGWVGCPRCGLVACGRAGACGREGADDVKRIDEARLETDLGYRFGYLGEFMGFGAEDISAIHGAAGAIGPLVPALVDAVYDKLFSYDSTKRHFLPRQFGYDGPLPEDLELLTQDHAQIKFRKSHLAKYLEKLVTADYNGAMVKYLDVVGKIHTHKAGNPALNVPLVQMNALMGFVSDALVGAILGLGLDRDAEVRTIRAFNKLLWLQNDLITRHYQDAQLLAPEPAVA